MVAYETIRNFLRTLKLGDKEHLWMAKLLYIVLTNPSIDTNEKAKNENLNKIVVEFFMETDVRRVPVYILRKIIGPLHDKGIRLSKQDSLALINDLRFIEQLLPESPGFWGELEHYSRKSYFRIRRSPVQELLSYPSQPCTMNELIRWWGSYERLDDALRLDPSSFPIIKIIKGDRTTLFSANLTQFLERFSGILRRKFHISRNRPKDFELTCQVVSRTIGANLIHRATLGLDIPNNVIGKVHAYGGYFPIFLCGREKMELLTPHWISKELLQSGLKSKTVLLLLLIVSLWLSLVIPFS